MYQGIGIGIETKMWNAIPENQIYHHNSDSIPITAGGVIMNSTTTPCNSIPFHIRVKHLMNLCPNRIQHSRTTIKPNK